MAPSSAAKLPQTDGLNVGSLYKSTDPVKADPVNTPPAQQGRAEGETAQVNLANAGSTLRSLIYNVPAALRSGLTAALGSIPPEAVLHPEALTEMADTKLVQAMLSGHEQRKSALPAALLNSVMFSALAGLVLESAAGQEPAKQKAATIPLIGSDFDALESMDRNLASNIVLQAIPANADPLLKTSLQELSEKISAYSHPMDAKGIDAILNMLPADAPHREKLEQMREERS